MVVHDLRTPSENIHHGLSQAQDYMKSKTDKIMKKTQDMVLKLFDPNVFRS
jgi:hypothetical protein